MIRNRVISVLSDDLSQHKQLVEKFKSELSLLPEGSLCLRTIRGADRFYHYIPSSSADIPATLTYIAKDKDNLKKALARRKFIEESLDVLESNIELLRTLLDSYITYDPTAIIEEFPKSYQGIDCSSTFGLLKANDPSEWSKESFEKNPRNHEGLTCTSTLGLSVRSKSESIIASQLETNTPLSAQTIHRIIKTYLLQDGNHAG